MSSQAGGYREDVEEGGGDGSKHVKGKKKHQLQKFTPLGLISCVTVLYFAPRGEGGNGGVQCPLGLFLYYHSKHVKGTINNQL